VCNAHKKSDENFRQIKIICKTFQPRILNIKSSCSIESAASKQQPRTHAPLTRRLTKHHQATVTGMPRDANSVRKAAAVIGESVAAKRQRKTTEFVGGVLGLQGKPLVPAGDDGEFEIAAIVDIRLSPVQFRVRWKGFGATEDTWESVVGLKAAKRKVDAVKVERVIDLFEKCEWEQKQVLSLEDKNDKLHDKVELMRNIHEEDEVLLIEMAAYDRLISWISWTR
jgi:hypothetical protein